MESVGFRKDKTFQNIRLELIIAVKELKYLLWSGTFSFGAL
jgi:hypothetical protein